MKFIKKFWQENKLLIAIFVVWRTFLFIVGFIAFYFLPFKASFPLIDETLIASGYPQWIWHWGNFDGVHYLDIAKNGYHGSGVQVFFPMFPMIIRLVSILLQNQFLSGFLVSNLCLFFASIIIYKLITVEINKSVAWWTILFLYFNPFSFFFGSIYTESLFLLLSVYAFYLKGFGSGLFASLASSTRLAGIFLSPILVLLKRNYWGFLGILGFFGYALYLKLNFNNFFYFISAQGAFKNERATSLSNMVTPPQVIFRYIKIFLTADPASPAYWVAMTEFTSFIIGVLILLFLMLKKNKNIPWLVFSWLSLLLPVFSGTLSSMPRYLLTIFPLYVGLAQLKQKYRLGILILFIVLLAWFTTKFVRGYWVS